MANAVKISKAEDEITELRRDLESATKEEVALTAELTKAEREVITERSTVQKAQEDLRKAEDVIRNINTKKAANLQEKSKIASQITRLDQEITKFRAEDAQEERRMNERRK